MYTLRLVESKQVHLGHVASGEVILAISGLNTFGSSASGRGIGVMLHRHLTLMHS